MGYSKVTGTVQYLHYVEQNGSDFPKSEIQKQVMISEFFPVNSDINIVFIQYQ